MGEGGPGGFGDARLRPGGGRTAALKNPHAPGSLAWLAWIAARLGGWSGHTSKGYEPPGPLAIARGLAKLDGIAQGWRSLAPDMRSRRSPEGGRAGRQPVEHPEIHAPPCTRRMQP